MLKQCNGYDTYYMPECPQYIFPSRLPIWFNKDIWFPSLILPNMLTC